MLNEIKPIESTGLSLETVILRAENVSETLSALNIRDAVTHSGERYKHDLETGTHYVAVQGVCVALRENTITLVMPRSGADITGTLAETTNLTQSLQGAVTGLSQATVSRRRKAS